jgi:hypothetical protein
LQAAAGRALQQNAGAAAARGALLWFLHCDSRPDARALDAAAQQDPAFDALGWFAKSSPWIDLCRRKSPCLVRKVLRIGH